MAVDATLMFREVDLVSQSGMSNSHFRIDCQLLVNGKWLTPHRLDLYTQERNYEASWGEELLINITLGLGTYTYQVLQFRDNLVAELKFVPLTENSDEQRSDINTQVVRYRAILIDQDNQALTGKHSQATTEEALNQAGLKEIQLQLLTETNYRMNMIPTGRLFRQVKPMDAVVSLLTESIAKVKGNGDQQILGINVTEGHNPEPRKVINLAHGIKMTQVVSHVQDQEGGLYPTGCGCFIQDQYWWVYPLYDTDRVNKQLKTLTVYNVPSDRLDGAERTYRETSNQVIVLATGDASALDPSLFEKLNQGNGLRFTDARKLIGGFAALKDNRMLFDRASNVFEVAASKLKTEFNNIAWTEDRSTANPFKHYSEMAKRNGRYVTMTWRHGDCDLLKPGMPVKFSTVHENQMRTYNGVLLGVQEQRIPAEAGAVSRRHPSSVILRLFINPEEIA